MGEKLKDRGDALHMAYDCISQNEKENLLFLNPEMTNFIKKHSQHE